MDNAISAPSKALYNVINTNLNSHPSNESSHWHENWVLDANTIIQWSSIYSPPTTKKEGDLQYKLLHNILPSLQVLHHLNPAISSTCGWCGDKGTAMYLFITCPSVQPLLNCLHSLLQSSSWPPSELWHNYTGPWSHVLGAAKKEAVRLSNFLIVSCKSVIYNLYRTSNFIDPLKICTHRINNKIIFEYNYFKLVSNDDKFNYKNGP